MTDTGELDKAAEYANRAIAADPQLADPHVWLGYTLMRWNKMDEALAEELRAAELDPDNGFRTVLRRLHVSVPGKVRRGTAVLPARPSSASRHTVSRGSRSARRTRRSAT